MYKWEKWADSQLASRQAWWDMNVPGLGKRLPLEEPKPVKVSQQQIATAVLIAVVVSLLTFVITLVS